jgi:glycolate oxidase subunit GlcD
MNSLDRFLSLIDRDLFSDSPVSTAIHAYDATNRFSLPAGVVRPRNAEDLRSILQAATATHTPIFPRGAGTGFSGGSVPRAGGIVLDFLGMNRLIDLDETDMTAIVEPGLITLRLAEAAEECGLFYPPDPASIKTCTIGGNVAENAGGPHCLKYGVTRDYILAIDAFTMAGEPFRAGRAVHKNRAGYDLRHLLIGSEGTLAVFSQFTVKLISKPEDKLLFLAFFSDFNEATRMVNTLYLSGIQPSSLEFMDEFAIRAVDRHSGLGLPDQVKALLYIEVDGRRDDMPFLQTRIEACLQGRATEVRLARDHAEQERLWEIRRKTSPAMRQFGNTKANEDIVVPRRAIPEAILGLREISERLHLNIINFGHIGDGNIHVNIMYDGQNEEESKRAHLGITEVFALVNRLGGAISGEHGIGLAKKPYLPANLDPVSLDLMKRIKREFDPLNLLNPGKIFDLPR